MSEPVSELLKLAAKTRPRKRNSKLDPYLEDLRELQRRGYSLAQMEEFLAQINVIVSRQTIHDFLKRRANAPQADNSRKDIDRRQTEEPKQEESINKNEAGALTDDIPQVVKGKSSRKFDDSSQLNYYEQLIDDKKE